MLSITDNQSAQPFSLYIHIPFCRSRCAYCAFNTYAGLDDLVDTYVQALCEEIAWLGRKYARPAVHTIYFGGGTPSTLAVSHVAEILAAVHRAFSVTATVEISFEANPEPGIVDRLYLAGLLQLGVTRLSFGVQSAQAEDLRLFNRRHLWSDVEIVVENARAIGMDNINLDLIYGFPGQSMAGWRDTLRQILALQPPHLSFYSMGIEDGTALAHWVDTGRMVVLEDGLVAAMYETASDMLDQQGFLQYEISNWARASYECQHNLQYWRRQPYLGVGAGAHSFIDPTRYMTVKTPQEYIHRCLNDGATADHKLVIRDLSPAVDFPSIEILSEAEAQSETMFLGLRLLQEGVSLKQFRQRFGKTIEVVYPDELQSLVDKGQLIKTSECVKLAKDSRFIANQVFCYFV